jgi:hypothetical protein
MKIRRFRTTDPTLLSAIEEAENLERRCRADRVFCGGGDSGASAKPVNLRSMMLLVKIEEY